jgi:antiviral helicase SLH1
MAMITLLQCVKSARWPHDGPLSILPGVEVTRERHRVEKLKSPPTTTAEIGKLSNSELALAMKQVKVLESMKQQFTRAASMLPFISLSTPSTTALSLSLTLTRQNPPTTPNPSFRVWAPRFPKPQTEGWFVIVGDETKDEILALKRVGWDTNTVNRNRGWRHSGGKPAANCTLKLPENNGRRIVSVLVVSDAYIGMVFRVDGVEVPAFLQKGFDDPDKRGLDHGGPSKGSIS